MDYDHRLSDTDRIRVEIIQEGTVAVSDIWPDGPPEGVTYRQAVETVAGRGARRIQEDWLRFGGVLLIDGLPRNLHEQVMAEQDVTSKT